jgi:hypothetical protein
LPTITTVPLVAVELIHIVDEAFATLVKLAPGLH